MRAKVWAHGDERRMLIGKRFMAIPRLFCMSRLFLLLLLGWLAAPAIATPQFKIITLQHRLAEDLLPVLQPLAGHNGSVSAFSNQVIVNVEPEALSNIEATIRSLDTVRRTWRITVGHATTVNQAGSQIGVAGEIGRKAKIRIPDSRGRVPRDTTIIMEENQYNRSESGSMDISALDGEAAFIRVGQEVPYTSYWIELCRRYARIVENTQWRDISLGFAVRPRQIGEMVSLEITPRLAELHHSGIVDFTELSATVQVHPGEWVDLGGMLANRDEVSRAILNNGTGSRGSSTQLRVKVQ